MADVKTKKVDFVYRQVIAPTYANDQFQVAGLREPLRFDKDGVAWICVEEDGEPVNVVTVDGEAVPAIPKEGEKSPIPFPRGFSLGETKTKKVEVAAD